MKEEKGSEKCDDGRESRGTGGSALHLDAILVKEVGQFGLYQARSLLLVALVAMFAAGSTSEYIFTTARTNTRCLIPECETENLTQFSPEWLPLAVPHDEGAPDACLRYSASVISAEAVTDTCPANLFDTNTTLPCEQYVYENTHSIVYDFELACQEWRRSLIGSLRVVGTLVSLPLSGYVSDRWGRRTALIFTMILSAVIGFTRAWITSYEGFLASQVIEAIFGGSFTCGYILLMEIVGPEYRVHAGAAITSFFSIGQILLGLVAWGIPNWKNLTMVVYLPHFIIITYYWLLSDSVRWYMSKGRYDESETILKEVARMNKKHISQASLDMLRDVVENEHKLIAADTEIEPWLVSVVFQHKAILLRCAIMPFCWISTTLIFYGLSINAVNLTGNRYLNFIAISAAELPGFWLAVVLANKAGRKPVLIGAFWICSACQIGYIFIPTEHTGASLALYILGKFSISMVTIVIYTFTAELFPTKYRHRLFSFCSMVGRVGSIVAPLTPALGATVWVSLPYLLFGLCAALAGLLLLAAPETLGVRLPDTMRDVDDIGTPKLTTTTTNTISS